MSIVFRYDGALLPFQSVRLTGSQPGGVAGLPSAAWYGEAVFASLTIDDPTGTLNFEGHHTFTVEETLCSKPRIFTGWITARDVSRGPYVHGAGRVWDCEIIDQNWVFHLQALRSTTDSVRPAETDVARAQAVITSGAMVGTPIHDNGRFNTSGALSLSAANFVAQYADDVLNSTAGQSGKNYYAYWDDSADQISFHYDLVGAGPAATISVSNVLSDVNGTTVFAPSIDAVSTTDPSDLYTGVLLMTAAGNVFGENQTVIDALSPSEFSPSEFKRDIIIRSDRISKVATRDAFLQKYLTIHSIEKQTLTFTVQLPAAKVNLACAGDVMNVRFSHLPNFTTSTAVSIIKRTVVPHADDDDIYDVHFECNSFAVARGPGGGNPGDLPAQPCTVDLVQEIDGVDTSSNFVGTGITLPAAPTPGNLVVVWIITRNTASKLTPTGFTGVGTDYHGDPSGTKSMGSRFFYKFAVAGDTANIALTRNAGSETCYVHVSEWAGVDTFNGQAIWDDDTDISGVGDTRIYTSTTYTPVVGSPNLLIAGYMPSLNVNDSWHPRSNAGFGTDLGASGVGDVGSGGGPAAKSFVNYLKGPSGSLSPTGAPQFLSMVQDNSSGTTRGWAVLLLQFSGDPCTSTSPPPTGQPVTDPPVTLPGDGSTTGTTGNGYTAGSLLVFVDGVFQPVIELDSNAGTYQLYFVPRGTEVVIAKYQAA